MCLSKLREIKCVVSKWQFFQIFQMLCGSEDIVWFDYIFKEINIQPLEYLFLCIPPEILLRIATIGSAKVEERAKMWFYCTNPSCLFTPNVMRLYYESLPLFVYFVHPVSLFCFLIMFPVQAMPLIWEGGHSFVQSLKGECEVYPSWSCLSLVTSFLVAANEAASESSQAVPFFK